MGDDFLSNEFEKNYETYRAELWVRSTRFACILAIVLIPTGIVLDFFIFQNYIKLFLLFRLVSISLIFGLFLLINKVKAPWQKKFLGLCWLPLTELHICAMIGISQGFQSPYYIAITFVMMGGGLLLPWSVKESIIATIIVLSMYLGACFSHTIIFDSWITTEEQTKIIVNNLVITVLYSVVFVTGTYILSRFRSQEVKFRYDLEKSQKELEQLDHLKNQFFANVSHELRTPLTLILSPVERLQETADPKSKEYLDLIYSNALRLLGLINNLLDLVRLEQGRLELKSERLDLNALLNGLVSSVKLSAEKVGLFISFQQSEEPLVTYADRDKIETILLNLLFNAIKFTPHGGTIRVGIEKQEPFASIYVKDSGIGISEENLTKVFQRFWQDEASATRKRQGTGIGLALVKEMVELHGGSVSVESQYGEGSTFTVNIPLHQKPLPGKETSEMKWLEETDRKAKQAQMIKKTEDDLPINPPEPTDNEQANDLLLIIEDEPEMRRYLVSELSSRFQIIVACDGADGLEMALKYNPVLILSDMMLPKINGIDLCKKLRASPSLASCKIIILTARADDKVKISALESGADDFLTKPFGMVELRTRLINLLLASKLERELQSQNRILRDTLRQLREAETKAIQNARLSSLGTLTAGIMHEINNPLNFLLTAISYLRRNIETPSEDTLDVIKDLEEGLQRIHSIIKDLKGFAHGGHSSYTECDPDKIWNVTQRLLHSLLTTEINLDVQISKIPVRGNENQLVQLLVNIVQNSIQATEDNPSISKTRDISINIGPEEDRYLFCVRDNGKGMSNDEKKCVFDPFFTTKDVGTGTGLGLSICHTIVKQHGGRIDVDSKIGDYTQFTIELPYNSTSLPPKKKKKEEEEEPQETLALASS